MSRGSYVADNTTARTHKTRLIGRFKRLGSIKPKEKRYFDKTRKKFRSFRIIKGKRKPLKNVYIEKKGRALIDTLGEKKGLSVSRLLKEERIERRKLRAEKIRLLKERRINTKPKIRKIVKRSSLKSRVRRSAKRATRIAKGVKVRVKKPKAIRGIKLKSQKKNKKIVKKSKARRKIRMKKKSSKRKTKKK